MSRYAVVSNRQTIPWFDTGVPCGTLQRQNTKHESHDVRLCRVGIGRVTVTSHVESRGRQRRLVGRRETLAAIFLVFTLYSSANKELW